MASIGDLIMRVVADMKGFSSSVVKEAGATGDKAGKTLSAKMKAGVGQAKGGILAGLGLGAGLGVIGLASSAVGALTDVVKDSIKAFNEDQVSQQKLRTSLKANVPLWDENTEAIEETLKARVALGFSDDEQRESLAKLVAATHDVTKALELQRTAMDLARFSGVDLATATADLIKINSGQFRGLKKLGIQVDKNMTSMEALAKVQAVVAGGAEDYAETNEGKVLVAQLKVNEAMEQLGAVLAGPIADATAAVADGIVGVVDALGDLDKALSDATGGAVTFGDAFGFVGDVLSTLPGLVGLGGGALGVLKRKEEEAAKAALEMRDSLMLAMSESRHEAGEFSQGVSTDLDDIGDAAGEMQRDVTRANELIEKSYDDLVSSLIANAHKLIDDFFGAIDAERQRYDAHVATSAAIEARAAAKTADARRDAGREIEDSIRDQGAALFDLQAQGKLTADKIDTYESDMEKAYKALGQRVPKELRKVIAELRKVQSYDGARVTLEFIARKGDSSTRSGPKALGGHVVAGGLYRVNENTPNSEFFRPSVSGRVMTTGQAMKAVGSGASGDTNFNLTVAGDLRAEDKDDVLNSMNRLRSIANRSFHTVR